MNTDETTLEERILSAQPDCTWWQLPPNTIKATGWGADEVLVCRAKQVNVPAIIEAAMKLMRSEIDEAVALREQEIVGIVRSKKLGKPNLPKSHPEYKRCCEDNEVYNQALKDILATITKH